MTQAPTGGPAQTVYQVSSRQGVAGREAQRVVVVTDGRPAEGGPQQAAYFVSAEQVAAGDFIVTGNKPLPIVKVGAQGATYPAIAVYDVTGMADDVQPPQTDIGDALRADTVMYFTLNEESGTRSDATGHGHNATEAAGAIGFTAGRVGNAALNNTENVHFAIANSTELKAAGAQSFAFCFWVKIPPIESAGDTRIILNKGGASGDWPYDIDKKADNSIDFYIAGADTAYPLCATGSLSEGWHFICEQFECGVGLSVRVDDGPISLIEYTLANVAEGDNTAIDFFKASNLTENVALDEFLFILRPITDDEYIYLYNNGAGRALFPAP